jgi:hypothetical protein
VNKAGSGNERFDRLAGRFRADARVSEGTGFGASPGLRVGGKIFAMLAHGRLVVKLPRARVDDLVAAGAGERFDPGHGRIMKEWIAVPDAADADWGALAGEAFEYVASRA